MQSRAPPRFRRVRLQLSLGTVEAQSPHSRASTHLYFAAPDPCNIIPGANVLPANIRPPHSQLRNCKRTQAPPPPAAPIAAVIIPAAHLRHQRRRNKSIKLGLTLQHRWRRPSNGVGATGAVCAGLRLQGQAPHAPLRLGLVGAVGRAHHEFSWGQGIFLRHSNPIFTSDICVRCSLRSLKDTHQALSPQDARRKSHNFMTCRCLPSARSCSVQSAK